MIYLLVGHRGVGKTSLLKRIKEYDPLAQCWDLDQEIVKSYGKTLHEIFEKEGESRFRQMEQAVFQQRLADISREDYEHLSLNHYIALGAGFEGLSQVVSQGVSVVWVRRVTDDQGRVFLHRPSLAKLGSEYEEYLKRFHQRDQRYRRWAHWDLTLIEGLNFKNPWEAVLFRSVNRRTLPGEALSEEPVPRGQLTLRSCYCRSFESLQEFLRIYEPFFTHFELRDDLLSPKEIKWAMDLIPHSKLIYSYRKDPSVRWDHFVGEIDWPLEWGEPPPSSTIISLHQRSSKESVKDCCLWLEEFGEKHLKLAIPIGSFEELWEAHQWWVEDPKNRSFLPISGDGRWDWYRLRQKPQMKINFVRLGGEGSALDQPLLLDWWRCLDKFEHFAAVLGVPVKHSHSPIEQEEYFRSEGLPVFKIKMNEVELKNLHILKSLGLKCAAMTSPLKKALIPYCDQCTDSARRAESVNTLFLGRQSLGHNTDLEGLKSLFDGISSPVVVWGGGGHEKGNVFNLTSRDLFLFCKKRGVKRQSPGCFKKFPRMSVL